MRRIDDILQKYDSSNKVDAKKIQIIEWFQKHPGKRFDISEVAGELGDDLEIGRGRIGQILGELEDESVLESHGDQRKAYKLADDILIPVRYQAIAGIRHLWTVIDVKRWGIAGFLVMSTVLWAFLTFPFWFFSTVMLLSPTNRIGPLTETEITVFTLLMTIWLLMLAIITVVLQLIRRWWHSRGVAT